MSADSKRSPAAKVMDEAIVAIEGRSPIPRRPLSSMPTRPRQATRSSGPPMRDSPSSSSPRMAARECCGPIPPPPLRRSGRPRGPAARDQQSLEHRGRWKRGERVRQPRGRRTPWRTTSAAVIPGVRAFHDLQIVDPDLGFTFRMAGMEMRKPRWHSGGPGGNAAETRPGASPARQ